MEILGLVYWNPDPVVVTLGRLTVRWYGILFMLSFLMGMVLFTWIYRSENKPDDDVGLLILFMIVGTIVGTRLGHCFFYHPAEYLAHPANILKVWNGGLSSHGGAIGIGLALYLYSLTRANQPFVWVVDRASIPLALGASFVRMGNLVNAEILGKPTDLPWAFVFERKHDLTPRHPVQIYEAIAYVLIFAGLVAVYRRLRSRTPPGLLIGLFLTAVFTARFFIEFLKERQTGYLPGFTLNTGQMLSIPLVVLGIAILGWTARRGAVEGLPRRS